MTSFSTNLLLALATLSATQAVTTVVLPSKPPAWIKPLSKDLIGLSIEMDRWPSWAGQQVGQPNTFLNQVLDNLSNLTGKAVPLRVGADSEDHGYLAPGVQVENATFPAPTAAVPYPEASVIGIGKDFYALSANLPDGTPFTWGVNLKGLNQTESVAQAELLYDTFFGSRKATLSKVKLEVIEIGNEPDFYNQPAIGTSLPGWNIFSYISQWTGIATKISESVSLDGNNTPKFQIGAFIDIFQGYVWDAVGCLGSGVLDAPVAKYISTYATHWYFGIHTGNVTTDAKPGQLMGRSYVRSNTTRLSEFASQSNAAGLDFVVSETNSLANHGTNGVSDATEAAIWFVDYAFQAASVGVSRLFFHEGIGFAYNLIQPVAVTAGPNAAPNPRIQASYYGAVIANEAIGLAANTRIAELAVNASNTAAYGIWEGNRLARAVLLNFDVYLPTVNATRLTTTVNLQGFAQGSKVSVKRLSAPATNATQGLTWGGVSYETLDGKPNGTVTESWLSGPTVQMNASEVVLLCFK